MPTTLTCFHFDHGHPDLGTERRIRLAETKAVAVLDANVFFDLQDTESTTHRQSQSLCADWISEYAALWITDELYNEIDRQPDANERRRRRDYAQGFDRIQPDDPAFETATKLVTQLLPPAHRPSDESDRRHLAAAIAVNADFFVTRDDNLLGHAAMIVDECGVEVVSPLEFILGFDELRRKAEYQPARLAGSGLSIRLISAKDVACLSETFLGHSSGEKKSVFEQQIRDSLIDPSRSHGFVVSENGADRAMLVTSQRSEASSEVLFFRVLPSRLAPTLSRHLIFRVIKNAVAEKRPISLITDKHCSAVAIEACEQLGFLPTNRGFVKASIVGIKSVEASLDAVNEVCDRFSDEATAFEPVIPLIRECCNPDCAPEELARLERMLWPLKIEDARLPSFMVPIQAKWATHLFDEHLANQHLFAADSYLALQCENVYYRTAKTKVLKAPGRVLWYVPRDVSAHQHHKRHR